MLILSGTEIGQHTEIRDAQGGVIKGVASFDTETKEAQVYLFTTHAWGEKIVVVPDDEMGGHPEAVKPLIVSVKLEGCIAVDRLTGKELK